MCPAGSSSPPARPMGSSKDSKLPRGRARWASCGIRSGWSTVIRGSGSSSPRSSRPPERACLPAGDSAMRRLAASLEAVGATASKLQKIDRLAAYLRTLDDDDLRIACTYLTGATFPAGDPRALNVGGAALVEALLAASARTETALHESYLLHGDLGSVAFDLLQQKATTSLFAAPLTLRGVHDALSRMAGSAGGGSRQIKREGLRALFTEADPLEAKYLVRIITSDLRVGLKEGLLEEAVARAFDRPVESGRRANMLISDVGEVAVLARAGRVDEAHLRPFRPFRFILP